MPRTFTNEPLGKGFRYTVKTERGAYCMGKSWIDTAQPNDMMDYDFTMSIKEGKIVQDTLRLQHIALQETLTPSGFKSPRSHQTFNRNSHGHQTKE